MLPFFGPGFVRDFTVDFFFLEFIIFNNKIYYFFKSIFFLKDILFINNLVNDFSVLNEYLSLKSLYLQYYFNDNSYNLSYGENFIDEPPD